MFVEGEESVGFVFVVADVTIAGNYHDQTKVCIYSKETHPFPAGKQKRSRQSKML